MISATSALAISKVIKNVSQDIVNAAVTGESSVEVVVPDDVNKATIMGQLEQAGYEVEDSEGLRGGILVSWARADQPKPRTR